MCIDPTLEQPFAVLQSTKPADKAAGLIADLLAKIDEAKQYVEFHHPEVLERIKALGVEVPAFSMEAPVLRALRDAIDASEQMLALHH